MTQVPVPLKVPNSLKRKTELRKASYDHNPSFELDPTQYRWKRNCKKCYGRGWNGFEEKSQKYLLCRCAKSLKVRKIAEVPKIDLTKSSDSTNDYPEVDITESRAVSP